MSIDISGIFPTKALNHLGMTVGDGTINWSQHHIPFSGVINTSIATSPTIVAIYGKFDNRFDDPRYYVGDATT